MASAVSSIRAHIGECDTLPWTNSTGSTVNGDTVRVVQNKVGLVKEDVDDGEDTVLYVEIPGPGADVPRNTNDGAWTAGDAIYLDEDNGGASNDQFTNQETTNTTSNPLVGYAYADTASGDSEGRVVLTNENIPA